MTTKGSNDHWRTTDSRKQWSERKIRDLSANTQTEIGPDRQVRDSKKRGIAIKRGKASLNDKSGKREKRRTS
jgi:hypothetical protein